MKALRSAHHTDPDVGRGLRRRRRRWWRSGREVPRLTVPCLHWSCVRSRKCPQKHLVNSSSVYLFRPGSAPPPAEIRLIPQSSDSRSSLLRERLPPHQGRMGPASCSRTRRQCGTWTVVCCVVDFAKPAPAVRFRGWEWGIVGWGGTANMCRAPEPSHTE